MTMGNNCLRNADALTSFSAPVLATMGDDCLCYADALTLFSAPALKKFPKHLKCFKPKGQILGFLRRAPAPRM